MYKNILVPIALDHSPNTGEALNIARQLRAKGGQITILTVVEDIPTYVEQYLPEGQKDKRLEDALVSLKAEASAVKDVKTAVISGRAGNSIVEYANEHEVDCIVIASHQPGMQDYFLGSTAARVVRHANCTVHVVR